MVAENTKRIISERGLKQKHVASEAGYKYKTFSNLLRSFRGTANMPISAQNASSSLSRKTLSDLGSAENAASPLKVDPERGTALYAERSGQGSVIGDTTPRDRSAASEARTSVSDAARHTLSWADCKSTALIALRLPLLRPTTGKGGSTIMSIERA